MDTLRVNIILIINASQENGEPPSRDDIREAVSLQVDSALDGLIDDGLVKVTQVKGRPNWRYKLADKLPLLRGATL